MTLCPRVRLWLASRSTEAKFYRNFGFRQFSVKTGLELSIPYAPTLCLSATIDSKQLVFLNFDKDLTAISLFKGFIFRF